MRPRILRPRKLQFILPLFSTILLVTLGILDICYDVGLAVFIFTLAAVNGFFTIVVASRRLEINSERIYQRSILGGKKINWSDITAAYLTVRNPIVSHDNVGASLAEGILASSNKCHIILFDLNGKKMIINPGYEFLEDVAEFVLKQIPPRMVKGIRALHNLGEIMSWGDLSITSKGLHIGGKVLEWNEISSYEVSNELLGYTITFHTTKYRKPVRFSHDDHVAKYVIILFVDEEMGRRAAVSLEDGVGQRFAGETLRELLDALPDDCRDVKRLEPATVSDIKNVEEEIGDMLPTDYVEFLQWSNGATWWETEVYGTGEVYLLDTEDEDCICSYEQMGVDEELLVISTDTAGNVTVLVLSDRDSQTGLCPVDYFDHNDLTRTRFAHSFTDWLRLEQSGRI